jgi:hypothetical protein
LSDTVTDGALVGEECVVTVSTAFSSIVCPPPQQEAFAEPPSLPLEPASNGPADAGVALDGSDEPLIALHAQSAPWTARPATRVEPRTRIRTDAGKKRRISNVMGPLFIE